MVFHFKKLELTDSGDISKVEVIQELNQWERLNDEVIRQWIREPCAYRDEWDFPLRFKKIDDSKFQDAILETTSQNTS